MACDYDAVLVVGFGGPEKPDDVIPFLENVLRGRHVPRERMLEVAKHYDQFGGVSPINSQVRELISALREELDRCQIEIPIYWGNRNWRPMLEDTLQEMTHDGITRSVGLVLAAYSSYSSCRQYREDIEQARQAVGEKAPVVDKIRVFYNHPEFVAANSERLEEALSRIPKERRNDVEIAFTAHSIPQSMADSCDYETQLRETCRLVTESLEIDSDHWQLVYQSRSGRPTDPWLEPDICDHLRVLKEREIADVVIMPIGFLSDHLEVLYDLDEVARGVAEPLGMNMVRAETVGIHPRFIKMLRELIEERINPGSEKRAVGKFLPAANECSADCCPAPRRPTRPQTGE